MAKPILCVDFDGVIHSYKSAWQGIDQIPDPPVPGALRWLAEATEYFRVMIYSSRSKWPAGIAAMRRWLDHYCNEQGVALAHVEFASEKPAAFLTIDDRAMMFNGDFSLYVPSQLIHFKPWYQRSNPNDVSER